MARAVVLGAGAADSGTLVRFEVLFVGVPGTDLDFVDVDVAAPATGVLLSAAVADAVKVRAAELGYALSPVGAGVVVPAFTVS